MRFCFPACKPRTSDSCDDVIMFRSDSVKNLLLVLGRRYLLHEFKTAYICNTEMKASSARNSNQISTIIMVQPTKLENGIQVHCGTGHWIRQWYTVDCCDHLGQPCKSWCCPLVACCFVFCSVVSSTSWVRSSLAAARLGNVQGNTCR